MKTNFETPNRYSLGYSNPYGDSDEMSMNDDKQGEYVSYRTYDALFKEYLELKFRLDGLEE